MPTSNLFTYVSCAVLLSACGAAEFKIEGQPESLAQMEDVICEPFSTDTSTDPRYGIYGRIHYLLDSQPRYTNVFDYLSSGLDVGKELYLSNVNVPTRSFSSGFSTASGLTIKRSDGVVLEEYFSLHLEAALSLSQQAPADVAGDYQLAVLSDDGSVVQTSSGGTYSTLIDNNGTHSTKMGCAATKVRLDGTSDIPIKIDYYQGPRTEIALVLLWRPWPSNPSDVNDPLCGQSGSTLFFDWHTTPSTPQAAYNQLLSRGWKPLRWSNFKMLNGLNKCVQ